MRKQNESPKTQADSLYDEMTRKITYDMLNDFIEDIKSGTTKCNICGQLITKKRGMSPCGTYYSDVKGHYVFIPCYVLYVKPLIAKLLKMKENRKNRNTDVR